MENRWRDGEADRLDAFGQLVLMSRLIGAEPSLVLWGGGNTSVKREETDFRGEPVRALRVKGSGSDLKSIEPAHFPGVRLEDVLRLLPREAMSDEEMVTYLEQALMEPGSARPSIETLLHGFLPHASVVHTHADAILSLTNTCRGEAPVREAFGERVAIIGYRRPGFALSKDAYEALRRGPAVDGLVLMNHGLITWGDSAKESYARHIELVSTAEAYLGDRSTPRVTVRGGLPPEGRREMAAAIVPALRGALGRERRVVLRFDDGEPILSFLARDRLERFAEAGAATPDHLLHTKRQPLVVRAPLDDAEAARNALRQGVADHVQRYRDYVARHAPPGTPSLDPNPRVILVPGLGMWTVGPGARRALIAADVYRHTIDVVDGAEAAGGYTSLSEQDAFDAEYWPLELYKLPRLPPERELARHVALVTGSGGGIGRAVALRLAAEGAHLAVTDVDRQAADRVAAEIVNERGPGAAVGLRCDVTSEEEVRRAVSETALAFGGIDVLVSNAGVAVGGAVDDLTLEDWERSFAVNARGHFLVSREVVRLMKQQGTGGSIVFNATKNVTAPGRGFAAYSAAKAAEAQLARVLAIECGEHGIRVNMVNPDAVFEGSGLWSDEVRRERAAAQGIAVEEIEEFYRKRNLLQVRVTAEDVADAVLFLAGSRSLKTTGAMIPVDGGLREGFVR